MVQGFRSSSVPVTHGGIWSSHADLSGSGPRANCSVFNTELALPLAAVSRSHVNNQPLSW